VSDSEEFLDPYLDPETGVLRNLIGARTKKSLEDAEGSLSFARLVQLMDRPPKPTGDLTELRAIHRHLFQDLYDWPGRSEPSTSARTSRVPSSSCRQG
jgi:cell filamentation protein